MSIGICARGKKKKLTEIDKHIRPGPAVINRGWTPAADGRKTRKSFDKR
jgi:hypothetical protein